MKTTPKTLLATVVLAATLLSACAMSPQATSDPTSSPAPQSTSDPQPTRIVEGTPVLWFFSDDEGVAKLREDMEAGRVPMECNVLYDQMGSLPEVVVTDPEVIAEIYDRLSQMIVPEGGRALSITDSYHHVYFTLQDGTVVGWSFEGERSLCWEQDLYPVSDEGGLWPFVRELQDELVDDGA